MQHLLLVLLFSAFAGTVQQIMKMRLAGKQRNKSGALGKTGTARADHINLNASQ